MAVSKCVYLDAKISLVPKHRPIVPSTLLAPATNIRTDTATKIQTLSFKIAQQKTKE